MADIEYTFAFSLPVKEIGLHLGDLEDMEAVACITIDEDGIGWSVDEFQIRDLPCGEPWEKTTDTLHLDPHGRNWITEAVKAEFLNSCHSVDIDRMVRAETPGDDTPTWDENERSIYHQSVL